MTAFVNVNLHCAGRFFAQEDARQFKFGIALGTVERDPTSYVNLFGHGLILAPMLHSN